MTPAEQQAAYDARRNAVEAMLLALPPHAQELARKYRRAVELAGRTGPRGEALEQYAKFVDDVRAAFERDRQEQSVAKMMGHVSESAGA